ncbi:restriction endonuclease subunit S [Actinobacillus pleuropneumoniae]|uniref:Restriction endonuclease subunit S n=1 Tax=Actinobacillus pleuropneumoniae TaxID=715 RepID=A0ABN5MIS9_ACTPL|nr:restriction endonuclease subunit S [Actinobacillus pleuropneumoniae]AWG94698.1 restriction endonuclease subunit S [Actinobacillus pleuropneumoniae serovar 1 str. 4074]AXA20771.1 restriction endonuclease subunit S [Actinobacillus pleuropneumoniae]EFM94932.1 Type I restriction enzyme EcoR124II specificity protein [Actinobacillus pleuropneumoniae serovar 9 str. CVJ13261]EFM99271.1 Type I restriction enzyme EcoR124II specificity protein [Actinobacillus pleuropneumoniae serovar 11 str. 56153]MCI
MNIFELIKDCKVEWKSLGEILIRTKGTKITAGQMKELHKENAPVKIFAGGRTVAFVDFNDIPQKDINNEPSIIVKSRGIIEFEYYDKSFSHKNEMWSYHSKNENINIKFVYYFLKQNEPHFQNIGSKMQMPQIATPDTDKYKIPIPPLEIQEKIVKTLDIFTKLEATLEATLEAELSLRVKQYDYYRNELLTFDDDVEFITLDKISENLNSMRKPIKSGLREKGRIPYYGASGIVDYVEDYIFDDEILLISEDGANLIARNTPIAFSVLGKCWVNNHAHVLKFKTDVERKFVEFYLNNLDLSPFISGAAQPKLNKQNLNKIPIPNITFATQQKIVDILDKFDRLTNSISDGLPKEIELRRKQYEYYREQLLGFKQ